MNKRLGRKFFLRPAVIVAKDLIGKFLVRQFPSQNLSGMIVETEAYLGVYDRASHAYGGKVTPRNASEYLEGGHVYIYLCYGMYWQLNITVLEEGVPECVLIRALEPVVEAKEKSTKQLRKLASGPGRLCRWMKLNRSFDREDIITSKKLWIEDRGVKIDSSKIIATKRIGIDYAGNWAKKPLRFLLSQNPFVSVPAK
jgi:DNA-3-methyladenine glycosylase